MNDENDNSARFGSADFDEHINGVLAPALHTLVTNLLRLSHQRGDKFGGLYHCASDMVDMGQAICTRVLAVSAAAHLTRPDTPDDVRNSLVRKLMHEHLAHTLAGATGFDEDLNPTGAMQ